MKSIDVENWLASVANLVSACKVQKEGRWSTYRTKKTTQAKITFLKQKWKLASDKNLNEWDQWNKMGKFTKWTKNVLLSENNLNEIN